MHNEMLYTALRIRADKAGGSGTVLFSQINKEGEAETYILTNHHVIDNLIKVPEEWDSLLGRKIKKERRATARAEFFQYNYLSRNVGQTGLDADVVAYDAKLDLALLKLRDISPIEHVATIIPVNKIKELHIFDDIIAIGAQLGVPPIATEGKIVYMDAEIDNERFNMGTYNSIYGSSGGSVFRYSEERDKYEFIGVPSRVTVLPQMFSVDTVTHMSYFIPIESVIGFLKDWCYDFVFDPNSKIEDCHQKRELKKIDARKNLERMYGVVEPEEGKRAVK
jgi:hypothetical protein